MRVIFEATSVEGLARVLAAQEGRPGQAEEIAGLALRVRGMSAEDLRRALEARRAARRT